MCSLATLRQRKQDLLGPEETKTPEAYFGLRMFQQERQKLVQVLPLPMFPQKA